MAGRSTRTMIAATQWGDAEYRTAGNYSVAGVIHYMINGELVTRVAAVGNSWNSVQNRTRRALRDARPGTLPSDYAYLTEVVSLTEATAPKLHQYFGTHKLSITQVFTPGRGWTDASYHAGRSNLRKLAKEGVTAVLAGKGGGVVIGRWEADFQMAELLKSMNTRKAAV
jgi:hypothetical protein